MIKRIMDDERIRMKSTDPPHPPIQFNVSRFFLEKLGNYLTNKDIGQTRVVDAGTESKLFEFCRNYERNVRIVSYTAISGLVAIAVKEI